MTIDKNEFVVLDAAASADETTALTELELNLILGGYEPGYNEQQNNPNGNALDLRDHSSGQYTGPGAMGPFTVGIDQAVEVARDAQDAANSAVYYGRHGVAEAVDVGSEVAAGYAGRWAPVVISAGDHIAEWIRPDGPPPVDHDAKK